MPNEHGRRDSYTILVIGGMSTAGCVSRIENALRAVAGVESAGVNLLTRMATVRHAAVIQARDLIGAVNQAGYQATLACPGLAPSRGAGGASPLELIASQRSRFVVGAILTVIILLVDRLMALSKDKVLYLFLLATPVQITVGWEYYLACLQRLRQRAFDLNSLIVLGATAAYAQGVLVFIGYVTADPKLMADLRDPLFSASAVILTIVSLGKWLESGAHESGSRLWGSLSVMMPPEARVLREGREQVIPAGVVAMGDEVIVRPGEKIPVDGIVEEGASEVNEALITGVGRPVAKVRGDKVVVASVNGQGKLRIRATGVGEETSLAHIARLVRNAQTHKAPVQQMADRVSGMLVPIVVLLALATFAGWYYGPYIAQRAASDWTQSLPPGHWLAFLHETPSVTRALYPAIAVLVVACPFALGLATPTVVHLATGLGGRRGLLFKGAEAIEAAGQVTDVIFDKPGVLTDGTYRVQEIIPAAEIAPDLILDLASSLEINSDHVLAKGLLHEAKSKTAVFHQVLDFEGLPGRGVKGKIGGRTYLLGSRALIEGAGLTIEGDFKARVEQAESSGATVVFLAETPGRMAGAIVLTDRVKETAPAAVEQLRAQRYAVHLLGGGNLLAAQAVGRQCGLKEGDVHPRRTTEEKIDFAWQLRGQGRHMLLVGDGINEAPIMAAADVGLVLGAGTDIATESGSIVLVSADPRGVPDVLRLARSALRIIRWNLVFAFAFNVVMIPLAMLNQLSIGAAAILMASGSVLVVLNSLLVTRACPQRAGAAASATPHPSTLPAAPLNGTSPRHQDVQRS